ncbi:MAG: Glu/Leu/Phe/Val dehydrogenase [Candidatus Pacebacteria bacterium]|nr:Glu/Leu/Phe/Val dehydrogenase [Candidatus Paceibacterota bacterium]MCF7863019.1 Glu/Leu/Phe/Val dehydrogenase [Candidatus Paceibacterota bacterium]
MSNPFDNAMAQLEKALQIKSINTNLAQKLHYPDRDIRIHIPISMDDGSTRIFEGYRVQYDNTLGPYKGGIRYHQDADINEVKALAFWMTIKCAIAGIPMGGGKGGIKVNPKDLSEKEIERLSRGWVQKLSDVIGPHKDVPAPDVNTTPLIMSYMVDEYEKITGDTSGAVITGKPIDKGGSEGRGPATGLGGFYVFETLRGKIGLPEKCKVVVQGFGNVGFNGAKIFAQHGHSIIAVSDSKGGVYNENGLDLEKLADHKKNTGSLADFEGSKNISNEELLALPCDVLAPSAFENVITKENVHSIQAKVILELANGPVTPEADDILFSKNIAVIPDVLANSGGVTVSFFEWDQNLKNEHWTEKDVFDKLQEYMQSASLAVWQKKEEYNTSLRVGAFLLALERIGEKMKVLK